MQLEKEQQEKAIQPIAKLPPLPSWPTSKPGPEATPPQPGERPLPTRTDQMIEVAYNMETGVSSARLPDNAVPNIALAGETPGTEQAAPGENRKAERHKKARR